MAQHNLTKVMNQLVKNVLIFLIISLTIFPLLNFISTYYHEMAHIKKAKEYGINFVYKPNLTNVYISYLTSFKTHPSGTSVPATEMDSIKYKNLDLKYKKDINLAGIKSGYNFINVILLSILLINLLLLFKKFRQRKWIYLIVYSNIILFYWLWYLIITTSLNIFYPIGDLQKLFY